MRLRAQRQTDGAAEEPLCDCDITAVSPAPWRTAAGYDLTVPGQLPAAHRFLITTGKTHIDHQAAPLGKGRFHTHTHTHTLRDIHTFTLITFRHINAHMMTYVHRRSHSYIPTHM